MNQIENLTEEDIQRELAGESVAGPRMFLGRPLAPLTNSLQDLIRKSVSWNDVDEFYIASFLFVLTEAYFRTPDEQYERLRALMIATDDIYGFKAKVSIWRDKWTDTDTAKAKELVTSIQRIVEISEVKAVGTEKKSEPELVQTAPVS